MKMSQDNRNFVHSFSLISKIYTILSLVRIITDRKVNYLLSYTTESTTKNILPVWWDMLAIVTNDVLNHIQAVNAMMYCRQLETVRKSLQCLSIQ